MIKLVNIRSIEIFTDGTINFSYTNLKSTKQVIFYEKDVRTSLFSKKITKKQSLQNLQRNSYKSKYKF